MNIALRNRSVLVGIAERLRFFISSSLTGHQGFAKQLRGRIVKYLKVNQTSFPQSIRSAVAPPMPSPAASKPFHCHLSICMLTQLLMFPDSPSRSVVCANTGKQRQVKKLWSSCMGASHDYNSCFVNTSMLEQILQCRVQWDFSHFLPYFRISHFKNKDYFYKI